MAVFSPLSLENRESRAVRIRGCKNRRGEREESDCSSSTHTLVLVT